MIQPLKAERFRLLATTNGERGDLFTRLSKDLFFALGYDDLHLDVHKTGREIDLQGVHRHESRRVLAECKAHADPIGGSDLNKFLGVLTRERERHKPTPIAGYFVSLSGFTESAREQEAETPAAITLFDSRTLIEELQRSRQVIDLTIATSRASQLAPAPINASVAGAELLGHELGYIWALFYAQGKQRTHLTFVHADGTVLSKETAERIVAMDPQLGALTVISAPIDLNDEGLKIRALTQYHNWLSEECGYIQLDGLPADTDLTARRLKLEQLFIPSRLIVPTTEYDDSDEQGHVSTGAMLKRYPRVALLSIPGGGKSTLLKRIASAYAIPSLRGKVNDDLPDQNWLPLLLRCRELRDRAHRPVIDLLDDIPRFAGMADDDLGAFRRAAYSALRNGTALLLIDGLDEISDEGSRQTFATHLRTFLAVFPNCRMVLTSRPAGFRKVAGVIADTCARCEIAPLNEEDVKTLCIKWHREVVADNESVRREAERLGNDIWSNNYIRSLAENPLLLTTLLVVKRWVAELPRSRAALYKAAIQVLVRTWNVEGYAPLDEEETLAQLSYVACWMMQEGLQQIDERTLLKVLRDARVELETELQFSVISPRDLVNRVEYRSSLLMQTGHTTVDNETVPVFEFRHLTFQEYLAARGYVEEQYPGRDQGADLATLLAPHFSDERWIVTISLAAVLAGRKADELISHLTRECSMQPRGRGVMERNAFGALLCQCIRDEIQVPPATIRRALLELGRFSFRQESGNSWVTEVSRGKLGSLFRSLVEEAYFSDAQDFADYASTLASIYRCDVAAEEQRDHRFEAIPLLESVCENIKAGFTSGQQREVIRAALICMGVGYGAKKTSEINDGIRHPDSALLDPFVEPLLELVQADAPSSVLAGSWALAWFGEHRTLSRPLSQTQLLILYDAWRRYGFGIVGEYLAWSFQSQELLARDAFAVDRWGDCDAFLEEAVQGGPNKWRGFELGALLVAWYRGSPWSDQELLMRLADYCEGRENRLDPTTRALIESFGPDGIALLKASKKGGARTFRKAVSS